MNWLKQQEDSNYKLQIEEVQKPKSKPKSWVLSNMEIYFQNKLFNQLTNSCLNTFSLIEQKDADRIAYSSILQSWTTQQNFNPKQLGLKSDQLRVLSTMLGLAIGDALGASTEFQDFDKHRKPWIENDFKDLKRCIENGVLSERHGQMGIWTDDCSMALAMSDSLLINDYKFDPKHIRFMFTLWLRHGLGNGGRKHSIGLGGNISLSMYEFMDQQGDFTKQGDQLTSGNGSLMRLAPTPLAFRLNQQQAMQYSALSSKTTHQGEEASECCRLLALIIVRLVNRSDQANWKQELQKACLDFATLTKIQSVAFLAQSKRESQELYNASCSKWKSFRDNNRSIEDRDWNWKSPQFTYSKFRAHRQPGYIGSYCMDALSMALHIVWHKNSFKEAILWAINMGGDCDTVGAIVGQIAGAAFGFSEDVFHLYSQMQDFTSKRYEVFLKGVKIATKRKANQSESIQGVFINICKKRMEIPKTNQKQDK